LARCHSRVTAVPPDAVLYCEARTRQEWVKAQAKRHPPTLPALRDQIQRLYASDQAARQTEGFEKHGVPTYEMVGVEAASMFVAMVQHQSPALRRRVLPRLKARVDAGQADAGDRIGLVRLALYVRMVREWSPALCPGVPPAK